MSKRYLLDGKISSLQVTWWHKCNFINNLVLLNYDKRYMLFNSYQLPIYAGSQTI